MTVALLGRDLLFGSRIAAAAERAGVPFIRTDDPEAVPPAGQVQALFVDWGDRGPDWGPRLRAWCAAAPESARPRLILFGPHVDLDAHAAAREAGLGPMRARSSVLADLAALVRANP